MQLLSSGVSKKILRDLMVLSEDFILTNYLNFLLETTFPAISATNLDQ